MSVTVHYQGKSGIEVDKGFRKPRAREVVASGNTGAVSMQAGEVAILLNTGSEVATVAHGSTPNASATTATAATSAAIDIPAGAYIIVFGAVGDLIAVA